MNDDLIKTADECVGTIPVPPPPRAGMRDFTTGSIPAHLFWFSLPMLVGNLLQALYHTVDSFWVGRFLGPEALAAVSVSFPILFALIALVMGLAMAATTMVAQYSGARDQDRVAGTVVNTLVLMTLCGVVVTILGIVFRLPILRLIRTPQEILEPAADYLGVFSFGLIFMFIYNSAGAILRGLGDSKTPLIFLAYSTGVNILLDPFLILGWGPFPRMGVQGAALATVIAQTVAAIMAVRYMVKALGVVKLDPKSWRLDRELTVQTVRIGFPSGIQQTLVSFGMLAVSSIINSFGPVVVAAYGAGLRIDHFALMPSMTIALAVSALVGQNLGAGEHERVRAVVRYSVLIATGIALGFTVLISLIPRPLLMIFTDSVPVLDAGVVYLRIISLSFVPFALMFTFTGVLRGAGDTMPTMLITIITLWLIRVPMAAYLSSLPALGEVGIWIAVALSPVIGVTLNWAYYLTGRWKKKVLVGPSRA